MPDHPQHTVQEPCGAFRESFLRFVERQDLHDAVRTFGDLLETLVLEAPRFIVSPKTQGEEPVTGTTTQHEVKAILLDLAAVSTEMQGVQEGIGVEGKEDARLAIVVSDLITDLDAITTRMQAALDAAIASETHGGA